jgi:1,4-alpha-glucan branching enzyme
MTRPLGYWVLVLHTHIPYVRTHGKSPHGTDWLCESLAECYLPLYTLTARLAKQGIPARYTISFTPILQEQLAHPDFRAEATGYMQAFVAHARDDQRYFLAHGDRWKAGLAYLWARAYEVQLEQYQSLGAICWARSDACRRQARLR